MMLNNNPLQELLPLVNDKVFVQTLLESMPTAVVITNQSGQIIFVNEKTTELFGYSKELLAGKTVEILIPQRLQEEHTLLRRDFYTQSSTHSIRVRQEFQARSKSGHEFPVEIELETIQVDKTTFTLAYISKTSVQQDAETRPQASESIHAELDQEKERVKNHDFILSMICHELRTPLATILLSVDMVQRRYRKSLPRTSNRHFERIKTQVQAMGSMLNDISIVHKGGNRTLDIQPISVDLGTFCNMIVEHIRFMDDGQHDLVFSTEGVLQSANADTKILKQILLNLLTNALKYSPKDSEIEFAVSRDEDNAIFYIRDHGIGIPEQDQASIFEPFFRATNARAVEGTVLGLLIVKNLVELHSGTLEWTSQEGNGTTFTVHLPVFAKVNKQTSDLLIISSNIN